MSTENYKPKYKFITMQYKGLDGIEDVFFVVPTAFIHPDTDIITIPHGTTAENFFGVNLLELVTKLQQ